MPSGECKFKIFKFQMKRREGKANGQSLCNKFIFNVNCKVIFQMVCCLVIKAYIDKFAKVHSWRKCLPRPGRSFLVVHIESKIRML